MKTKATHKRRFVCDSCEKLSVPLSIKKCKPCHNLYTQKHYQENKDRYRANKKRYKKENKEKFLTAKRKYEKENRASKDSYKRKWRKKNAVTERVKECKRRYKHKYGDFALAARMLYELECKLNRRKSNEKKKTSRESKREQGDRIKHAKDAVQKHGVVNTR